jgi:hypothetical protein
LEIRKLTLPDDLQISDHQILKFSNSKTIANAPYHCFAMLVMYLYFCSCSTTKYDTIIRNGMVYDGNGGEPFKADIAIKNDTIAFIGDLSKESAKNESRCKRDGCNTRLYQYAELVAGNIDRRRKITR